MKSIKLGRSENTDYCPYFWRGSFNIKKLLSLSQLIDKFNNLKKILYNSTKYYCIVQGVLLNTL